MKKYEKPQIAVNSLEASDVIAVSDVFEGVADLGKTVTENFEELIRDVKDQW